MVQKRKFSWLSRFIVIAVGVAALVAFMPLIGPMIGNSPVAFRDFISSAADAGTSAADAEPAAAPVEPGSATTKPDTATPMTVDYVHDGDTLFLLPTDGSARLKVRLIGLDTPEIGDNAECFGADATDILRSLLPEGSEVSVMADREPHDKYGRSLFYLWAADGRFINYELLAQGAANTLSIPPNEAYRAVFASAEDSARSTGVGLWGAC